MTPAYCGRDLASAYDNWLDLSVDHVIPANVIKTLGYPREWLNDLINLVTACRACNEFLNQYRVSDPLSGDSDRVLRAAGSPLSGEERVGSRARHAKERESYEAWRSLSGTVEPSHSPPSAASRDVPPVT